MSAIGTKPTFRPRQSMSAFGGKAAIGWKRENVRFCERRCLLEQPFSFTAERHSAHLGNLT